MVHEVFDRFGRIDAVFVTRPLKVRKARRKTKVSRAAKERRLDEKKKRGDVKRTRGKVQRGE